MVEMMLLGFLIDGEKTGYEIKKYMENSTHYFFNIGFSSIYPKFKKLEEQGLVKLRQQINNGKLNKVYTITGSGRAQFKQWLEIPPGIGRIRDEALLKVFFYDYLEDGKLEEQLKEYSNELKQQVAMLSEIKQKVSRHDIGPWKMTTLEFGIKYYSFMAKCFIEMLEDSKRKKTS